MRLSSVVTVLSSDDPIRVFQWFSTVDAASNGRAGVILGRDSFTESFPLFGFRLGDYKTLLEEQFDGFATLLAHDGRANQCRGRERRVRRSRAASVSVRESGTPRTSIGVGGSQASVVRAARYGMPLMLAIIGDVPRRFAPYLALYHQALAQFGRAVLPVGVHSPGRIAELDAQAREEVWPAYGVMRERIGAERGWPPTSRAEFEQEIANE